MSSDFFSAPPTRLTYTHRTLYDERRRLPLSHCIWHIKQTEPLGGFHRWCSWGAMVAMVSQVVRWLESHPHDAISQTPMSMAICIFHTKAPRCSWWRLPSLETGRNKKKKKENNAIYTVFGRVKVPGSVVNLFLTQP